LNELIDVVGRYVWTVEPRPEGGVMVPLPSSGPALKTLLELPGLGRLALASAASRTVGELSYPASEVSPDYFAVRRLALAGGRLFEAPDEAVVGHALRELLGEEVEVRRRTYRVVGVLASVAERSGPDWMTDGIIYLPLGEGGFVSRLHLETDPAHFASTGQALEAWLREHNLLGYQVVHLAERYGLELRQAVGRLLSGALGFGVAAVILAAGANLVAFFLTRTLERVRQLGVRRAVGASRSQVVREEVLGALPWAGAGLLLGLPLAYLGGGWLSSLAGVAAYPGPLSLTLSFLALLALVALCAFLPALWAVRQAPVQAIRGLAASLPQRRLLLAGAGLALGVAGLVLQASAARSAEREVERILGGMGERLGIYSSFLRATRFTDPRGIPQLGREDYRALLEAPEAKAFSRTAYVERYLAQIEGPTGGHFTFVGAFEGPLPEMVGLRLLGGRWPEEEAREAVVGEALAEALYGKPLPLGEALTLFGRTYIIVGVFRGGEEANIGNVANNQVLISLATLPRAQAQARGEILVEAAPGQEVEAVLAAGSTFLSARHEAPGLAPVHPHRPSELAPAVRETLHTLSAVYRMLAFTLLLLGGAGLAAQMLVSLSLRVREIGVRRATGATAGAVFGELLAEALRLGLAAGAAGALVGVSLSLVAARVQEVTFVLDGGWVGLALALALLVAGLFGAGPSLAASRIPPARAMRQSEA